LLITIVGLVVDRGRGMIGWGMVDCMVNGMVGNWGMVNNWGVVGNNRGSMNSVVNNRGMDCVVNRGSMMHGMSTESCERNSWATSSKRDKSNQSKDLHDVVV